LKHIDVSEILSVLEAIRTTETSVNFNDTIRRCLPEGCHLRFVTLAGKSKEKFPTKMERQHTNADFVILGWTLQL
jgi:hypothetical protein